MAVVDGSSVSSVRLQIVASDQSGNVTFDPNPIAKIFIKLALG